MRVSRILAGPRMAVQAGNKVAFKRLHPLHTRQLLLALWCLALAMGSSTVTLEPTRLLHVAVHDGDVARVQAALARGADINDNSAALGAREGRTPLMAGKKLLSLQKRRILTTILLLFSQPHWRERRTLSASS